MGTNLQSCINDQQSNKPIRAHSRRKRHHTHTHIIPSLGHSRRLNQAARARSSHQQIIAYEIERHACMIYELRNYARVCLGAFWDDIFFFLHLQYKQSIYNSHYLRPSVVLDFARVESVCIEHESL